MYTIVVIAVLLMIFGGGWGYSRYGYVGMSPAAILVLVMVALYFTGHLRLH